MLAPPRLPAAPPPLGKLSIIEAGGNVVPGIELPPPGGKPTAGALAPPLNPGGKAIEPPAAGRLLLDGNEPGAGANVPGSGTEMGSWK